MRLRRTHHALARIFELELDYSFSSCAGSNGGEGSINVPDREALLSKKWCQSPVIRQCRGASKDFAVMGEALTGEQWQQSEYAGVCGSAK